MRVVLADVERDPLDRAAEALAAEHGVESVLAVPTDVRDDHAVDALAGAAFERFGAVNVLCNNAASGSAGTAGPSPPTAGAGSSTSTCWPWRTASGRSCPA
jgi:NAD(P)-dependent dehydrogenase (short-subunit alcohol dehydrogenase family)